jgi:ABC-type dipeptide/oligopeptide/nickel transport system permease component
VISVFALVVAIGIGMALTRNRTRVPSMIMVGVLGVLSLAIYWYGLPMPIVLGVVASSVLLVFPAAIISPKKDSAEANEMGRGRVKCPSCGKRNRVNSDIRPLRIECKGCNSTLRIE